MTLDTLSKDQRNMAMLAHLLALSGFLVPTGNIIGPLIIWLIKKDTMPFVDEHGKESLNFQISLLIYGLAAWLLCFVFIGFLLLAVLFVALILFPILAAIKASDGQSYRYPLTLRLLK